ncbi:glycosyltransferase [Clostridium botulinum]|uniref:Glycosyltransferase n=1 Tax=Clostridium botulinum TaxID=1491 RepID=A0A6B4HZA4_CLOBO|nr:glycosyltransferase family 2 protein [Clostridium botulinum]MCS6111604.1 glycosyltransferase [Clostridium botulinum]NFE11023.1 glycosyltransferase [Clostridium botulinum]NFE60307.1 glycosyltransferase [Clostridium botulinum]NFE84157.1 glycosyltransferase [Clostridium botulinum]NFF88752.1 glycosyltransferase [Clostridium botulinum]
MNELISIIVPVYNVEEYLNKCIYSILKQSYSNIEVILIDDGSSDNSGIICDSFEKLDSRVRVIHSENKGVSNARNIGISLAKGRYIGFVDSDDWIEPDMYQKLYNTIKNDNSDISICDAFIESKVTHVHKVFGESKYVFNRDEIFNVVLDNIGFNWLCNKLFKKDLFKGIRLDENIYIGEDILCVCKCICNGESFSYLQEALYHYLKRNESVCNNSFNIKKISNIDAYEKIMKIYYKNAPQHMEKAVNAYILSNIAVSNWMISDKIYDKKLFGKISNNINNVLKGKSLNTKVNIKIKVLLFKINPVLLYTCTKIFRRLTKKE